MGGAESLLGESPQSYNPLSGATSFGATFPQSTQKLTGPRPAYASSKDGFLSAFSPPLTEQQQRQHQALEDSVEAKAQPLGLLRHT